MGSFSALGSLLGSSSSSSIDLSSILQAAYGSSSSGLDVTSAVNAALTAARAPETAWSNEAYTIQSQISALKQIQSQTSNLDNDLLALGSLSGALSSRSITSSNSNVVTATAAAGSASGNHVIVVNNLATTASWTSTSFASSTSALPTGSFTVTAADGSTTTITADGTKTLTDVANEINGDNLGVTASVITDATGARLALVANSSGAASNFSIAGDATFGFAQAGNGTNASLTVDGIQVSSATNTVSGVLSGITLNLLSANPGAEVSLGVAPNTSQAATVINNFVSDYNTLVNSLSSQFTFTGSSEGVLATDSGVRNLQIQLLGAVGYTYTPTSGTTTVPNLSSMGISVNNDGTLSVDSATLESKLQNNFSDVQNFFQGDALNGFANSLDQQLTDFLSPANGTFTVDLQSMNSQISTLQENINDFETNYITPLKAQLQSEYSQAEILLQQLPMMMKQIQTELGQNSGSNG